MNSIEKTDPLIEEAINKEPETEARVKSGLDLSKEKCDNFFFREFDPGSGRTLAACLTHASRTEFSDRIFREEVAKT